MQLTDHIHLIGSGRMGFNLTDEFDCHVYLVHHGGDAVIIDAGCGVDISPILAEIDRSGIPRTSIHRLLLTHAHGDHAGGTLALHDALGVDVWASPEAAEWVRTGDEAGISLDRAREPGGYPEGYVFQACPVAGELRNGDRIPIGDLDLEVIETPGHCRGHLSFLLHRPGGTDLFCGDAAFARGRILLQYIHDCSVVDSCESVRTLYQKKPDGFYPGHAEFSVHRGWKHLYEAMGSIVSALPPPQLS
ncbi:MAG TPA: MBL fold metallo-hydrolase [Thermomicrobiales bacterium]|nr:MBL fold metallo-hydrolase [Thermomicrobiales bacterium]